ncbi:unnamed protein product [Ectocarpus sp. 8 AP-2014]
MDASDAPLLDERSRDAPTLLSALQNLLQLDTPTIPMTKCRLQAVMGNLYNCTARPDRTLFLRSTLSHPLRARHDAHQDIGSGRYFGARRHRAGIPSVLAADLKIARGRHGVPEGDIGPCKPFATARRRCLL